MALLNSKAKANVTMKAGDNTYTTQFNIGGWDVDDHEDKAKNLALAIQSVSDALPTLVTITKFVDPAPIPQNTVGKRPRRFNFRIVENNQLGGDANFVDVSVRIPEYKGTYIDELAFISTMQANLRHFATDDIVQLIGIS